MTMMTATTPTTTRTEARDTGRSLASSIRFRLLAWFIILLTLATVASVLVVRQILYLRVDDSIDAELVQESRELRALTGGNDPETGEPFGNDVERIFEVFLERNIPSRNQALITYVDGEPFLRSRRATPYRLDTNPRLSALWANVTDTERDRVDTPVGEVEYLAIPIRTRGETSGVFVDAWFVDLERSEADPAVLGATAIGLVVLLMGSLLAWGMASKILRPIEDIRAAARSISDAVLSRRIAATGNDEVAELAHTFNTMLDRLEEAFRTQRQFVDDASHELRTPITVIQGHLELLEDDPEERKKTLALVMDELDRMNRFVNDLLLLSKAQRPDFLDLATVGVEELLQEIHAKSTALATRNWQIEATGRGIIVADRQRLTQAMMQLAQNATQHTTLSETISIGSSIGNGVARFWVRDTGAGISANDQARVFNRFTRARGSRQSDGAGLGLAIVQAIAEAHDGEVLLDSGPGEGSTFTIVIPTEGPRPHREGQR